MQKKSEKNSAAPPGETFPLFCPLASSLRVCEIKSNRERLEGDLRERRKKKEEKHAHKRKESRRTSLPILDLSLSVCLCLCVSACVCEIYRGGGAWIVFADFFFLEKSTSLYSTGSTQGTGKERALSSFFGRILFFFARNIIIVSPLRRGLFFGEEGISNGCSSFLLKYILRAGEEKKDILLLLQNNNNNNNNKQQRFLYSYAKSASSYYKHI